MSCAARQPCGSACGSGARPLVDSGRRVARRPVATLRSSPVFATGAALRSDSEHRNTTMPNKSHRRGRMAPLQPAWPEREDGSLRANYSEVEVLLLDLEAKRAWYKINFSNSESGLAQNQFHWLTALQIRGQNRFRLQDLYHPIFVGFC